MSQCFTSRFIVPAARRVSCSSFSSLQNQRLRIPLNIPFTKSFGSSPALCSAKKWKVGKINHLAVVTPDLVKSTKFYQDVLGAEVSEAEDLPEHGVKVVFVKLGETKLELLHPLGEKSPVKSFVDKNKSGGMHHICIEVDDLEAAMTDMRKNNIRLLSEESKIGAHGKPVVFLHPKDCNGVLVELEEA